MNCGESTVGTKARHVPPVAVLREHRNTSSYPQAESGSQHPSPFIAPPEACHAATPSHLRGLARST